jgi:hypothetical protein
MKIRSLLFATLLGVVAASQAQTFDPSRQYKVGMTESYSMTMNMESSMGEISMSMDMKNAIKKVYENGDADVETEVSNMTVSVGGREMNPPAGKPTTQRMSKYGVPVGASSSRGGNFAQMGAFFGDKELKVGEIVSFENTDKENPKRHSKGTAKLVSVENGVATIAVSIDSWSEQADKPMHLEGTSQVDATSHSLIRFEGKATNMSGMGGQGGPTITSATIVVTKKK